MSRSYEKELVRAARLDTLREYKRGSIHKCKYIEQVTSSRRSAPIEALADLVTQHGESSSFPFHVQRLNPP
jgi:5-deoxy-D-glucuronate isomerase